MPYLLNCVLLPAAALKGRVCLESLKLLLENIHTKWYHTQGKTGLCMLCNVYRRQELLCILDALTTHS